MNAPKRGNRPRFGASAVIVLAAQRGARACPAPILWALDRPRAHGVERHVARRRPEMLLIHDDGAEAALPEMAVRLRPRVNEARIAAMSHRNSDLLGWRVRAGCGAAMEMAMVARLA